MISYVYIIIIIIIRHAPCQCVAPLATNSLHSDLSKASSIASSKVRLCRDRSLVYRGVSKVCPDVCYQKDLMSNNTLNHIKTDYDYHRKTELSQHTHWL